MTTCENIKLSTIKSICAVGSLPSSLCVISTKTTTFTPTTSYELNYITTVIPVQNTNITNINIPKPTSQNLERSGVISTVHVSSSSNVHILSHYRLQVWHIDTLLRSLSSPADTNSVPTFSCHFSGELRDSWKSPALPCSLTDALVSDNN